MTEPTVATGSPLTTTDRVASAVGSSALDADRVAALIARSSAAFRAATGQHISAGTSTVELHGDGARELLLPQIPVTSVDAVAVNGIELEPGAYEWEPHGVIRLAPVRTWSPLGRRFHPTVVSYTHGYAEIPEDVAEAVAEHAAAGYRATPGVTAVTLGSSSYTFASGPTGAAAGMWALVVARYRAWLP